MMTYRIRHLRVDTTLIRHAYRHLERGDIHLALALADSVIHAGLRVALKAEISERIAAEAAMTVWDDAAREVAA